MRDCKGGLRAVPIGSREEAKDARANAWALLGIAVAATAAAWLYRRYAKKHR